MVQLLCVKARTIIKRINGELMAYTGDGLICGQTYTSDGTTINQDGILCYRIRELDGEAKLVERFREEPVSTVSKEESKYALQQK